MTGQVKIKKVGEGHVYIANWLVITFYLKHLDRYFLGWSCTCNVSRQAMSTNYSITIPYVSESTEIM